MKAHHLLGAVAAALGAVIGLVCLVLDRSGTWSSPSWLIIAFVVAALCAGGLALLSVGDPADLKRRNVQPRVVWAGVGLLVLGGVAAGLALVSDDKLFALPALVVVAVGALAAWLGGVMGLAGGAGEHGLGGDLKEVADDETREGNWPADSHDEPEVVEEAAEIEDGSRRISGTTTHLGQGDLRAIGAGTVLALAAWLFLSRWMLGYPFEPEAVDAYLMHVGASIVVTACGLYLVLVGRNVIASGLTVLVGIGVLLAGLFAERPYQVIRIDEIATGILLVVAGALSLIPRRGSDQERSQASASSR